MREIFIAIFVIVRSYVAQLMPGGRRAIMAEVLALRTQLIVMKRNSKASPRLTLLYRFILGLCAGFISKHRLGRTFIAIKPATVLKFHRFLVKRKYSALFGSKSNKKIGRPPISPEICQLIIQIKRQNPRFGCPQIAALVTDRTGISVGVETVRRILKRNGNETDGGGPSWLTFLGHQKDSLWSIDLFRVESIVLQTHWVCVVMDQYSRKIIGFAATRGAVTGANLCYMFNRIAATSKQYPRRLSRDNDPLFRYYQWIVNLDMMDVDVVRSIPFTPTSHPFVERLIGTVRREFTDEILFWNTDDLEKKLSEYQRYFNEARVHQGICGSRPSSKYDNSDPKSSRPGELSWQQHCRGLFHVPMAA